MLRIVLLFVCACFYDLASVCASQNHDSIAYSDKVDRQLTKINDPFSTSDSNSNVTILDNAHVKFEKFNSWKDKKDYEYKDLSPKNEYKSTVYYDSPVTFKNFLSRFFIGNHFSARMDAFQNSEIPFLARGSGVAAEVSTQSTNFTASYFKSNTRNTESNNTQASCQRAKQPLAGDTKLALAIPFLPQLKLFGGYSYNRSIEARLTKGPNFGFQADVFGHVKVDTTFIKQTVGKTAAKVLLSFSMPLERIKF
jgi:hypothetical protein